MSAAKKGLGRGFDSLIPADLFDETFDPTAKQDVEVSELRELPVSKVTANPDQPRRYFDDEALAELAESVRVHGILQPIIVVPKGSGYQIVAGERRFRAAQLAGLSEVPVIIRTLSDQHQLEISLIENIQRRDLNAVETATAYAKLRDQFNMTTEQIAERVHKSTSAVLNTLRLLKLPKEVLVAIAEGALNEGQARPLIGQPESMIAELMPRIIAESWSARRVEAYVAQQKNPVVAPPVSSEDLTVSEGIGLRLGAPVAIRRNAQGGGTLVIRFRDSEELDRIKNLF